MGRIKHQFFSSISFNQYIIKNIWNKHANTANCKYLEKITLRSIFDLTFFKNVLKYCVLFVAVDVQGTLNGGYG